MTEPERADPHMWFKARQEVFSDSPLCPLHQAFGRSESILKMLFDLRELLVHELESRANELIDTLLFYLDMTIEDYQSILILSRHGFFSAPGALLRRMLVGLGWINYLWKHADKCNEVRSGKIIRDRVLMEELRKSNLLKGNEDYELLCECTHVNFEWASNAVISRPLHPLNKQSYLAVESSLLSADRWALLAARTCMCIVGDVVGEAQAVEPLLPTLNSLLANHEELAREFDGRVDQFVSGR